MCHTALQLPTNDITWLVICGILTDAFHHTVAFEIDHQVGHPSVVDVFIGSGKAPVVGVFIKVGAHVFMYFFLQIDTQLSVSSDDYIGTHTFVGRHIAIGVVEAKVGRIVFHLLVGEGQG